MINISKSVGRKGQNSTTDLAKIQLALLSTKYLKAADFRQEMISILMSNSDNATTEKFTSTSLSFSDKLKSLPKSNRKISAENLTATIKAILAFQKKDVGLRNPDGRIDPNGRSLRTLNKLLKKLPKPKPKPTPTSIPTPFDSGSTGGRLTNGKFVKQEGKHIVIKITAGDKETQKKILIKDIRKNIFDNYNWNGIVKLMQFVYKKNKDKYIQPTNLSGTLADNELIIPDVGTQYVVQQQLAFELKKQKPTSRTLKNYLKPVDGKPGRSFFKNILKQSREVFMNEKDNNSLKDIFSNNRITIPSLQDDEASLYDFFRKIVLARNGLWSDKKGIVNLVGLRRVIDAMVRTAYNDSLIMCWKDDNGNPRVEINIATTEPGDRFKYRQIAPQTISTLFGYHQGKQPSGRTRKAVIQSRNAGAYVWEKQDQGMNFHQGENSFKYPRYWMGNHGFTQNANQCVPDNKFSLEQLFEMNLLLTEIYYMLSQYGANYVEAPYQILKRLANSKPMKIEKVENGIVTISQQGQRKHRKVNLHDAKKWMVHYWYHKRLKPSNRLKIFTILHDSSGLGKKEMQKLEKLGKDKILDEIKDEYVVDIIKKQMLFFPKLSDIDGKAGPVYYRTIVGIRPSIAQAKEDYPKVKKLINSLSDFPLKRIKGLQNVYRSGMRINTDLNRENVMNHTRYDELQQAGVIANATVRGHSAGCQVIYDTETFFDFWLKILKKAKRSGQRKWYYTLIDATKWKKTDVV